MRIGLHYSFQSREHRWVELYESNFEQIVLADKLGFDTVTIAEQHFLQDGWIPSPIMACSALATVTERIRLGTNAIVLPLHNPIRVCEDAVIADILSKGRFILGVCLGDWKWIFDKFGVPFRERRAILEEGLQLVDRLLREERVTHHGRYYHLDDVTIMPRPVQRPRPPLWIAAIEEPAIRRAARMGDAWIPTQIVSLKQLKRDYEKYEDELRRCGKDPKLYERPLRREAYVAEDGDEAWEECRAALEYEYGEVYFKNGVIRDEEGKRVRPGDISVEEVMEMMRRRFLIGSPDDFIDQAERYERELGVDLLLLRIQAPGLEHKKVMKSIRLIGERVIPYFKEREDK